MNMNACIKEKTKGLNNKGMTLIEMVISFAILSILLVVATQIIHSSTEVYYYTKTTSHGVQAAQIVSTEIRGDIEDALPVNLNSSPSYYIVVGNAKNSIEFTGYDGKQIKYTFNTVTVGAEVKLILVKQVYDNSYGGYRDVQKFDSKYIGMGYEVKKIIFEKFVPEIPVGATASDKLPISDYPVIKMTITVCNNQFGEFDAVEYIPIYGFYGLDKYGITDIWSKISIPN